MKTKTRSWKAGPVKGRQRATGLQSFSSFNDLGVNCSETNEGLTHFRIGGHWSGGGPFFLSRNITSPAVTREFQHYAGSTLLFDGNARMGSALAAAYPLTAYSTPTEAELRALGTTAIARTEPTNPAFDLSTFLGELRNEGLPNMPNFVTREQVRVAKNAGSNYLNVEFGWLPLVRGIRDFAKTVEHSDRIVRSYQERANRTIQRSYQFPLEQASHAEPMDFGSVPTEGGQWSGGGKHQAIYRAKWFEAEYIYYLPTGGSTNDKFRRFGSYARKLYGIDLSPEVLWNLAPWSWAADWFANVGDVMHNVSAIGTDGLVLRHAYMMCHQRKVTTDSGYHTRSKTKGVRTVLTESKSRIPATPYGFGLSYDGLTTKQKVIVAALGMSRW